MFRFDSLTHILLQENALGWNWCLSFWRCCKNS